MARIIITNNQGDDKEREPRSAEALPPAKKTWHETWWGKVVIGVIVGLIVIAIGTIVGVHR